MFAALESQVLSTIQRLYDQFGWLGVALVMVFENATSLSPSEITLSLAGWMLLAAHEAPFWMVFLGGLYAALGSTLGSSLAYWLVRTGGRPLVDRAFRLIRLDPRYIAYIDSQFIRWGPGLVLFGRVFPGIRFLVNIPAGLSRLPYPRFALLTFAGTYVWCTFLIGLGYVVGHEWKLIASWTAEYAPWAILVALILAAAAFLGKHIIQQRVNMAMVRINSDGED